MDHQDIASIYNSNAKEYAKRSLGHEDTANLVRFAHVMKPGAAVLDIGCAAGRDCGLLQSAGFMVTGADISARLLSIAKKSYPDIPFVLADMQALPFPNQSFEGIWASAVLHHAERDGIQQIFEEFSRVLKPGGYCYVLTKAGSGKLKTKEASVGNKEREFTLLDESELHNILAETGFKIRYSERRDSKSRKGLRWLCVIAQKSGSGRTSD